MRKKLLMTAIGGLSLSNHNLRLTRLSHPRPPKWVLIEASSFVGQSNTQRHGWSYAASVPSDKPNSQKRQRLSRDERRAMVESFVNKYRETNDGKFPNLKHAMKEVGGSFYVVREIIQELKYKSKMNSSYNMVKNFRGRDNFNVSKLGTTETVKVPSDTTEPAKDRPIQDDCQLTILDELDAGNEHLEDKRGPQTTSFGGGLSREAVITSSPQDSHFIAAESDQLQREAEPSKSNHWTPNDVKTDEAESSYSDFVVSETHPMKEEVLDISAPSSEMSGSGQSKGLNSELSDMENRMVIKKANIEKTEYDRREHGALKDLHSVDGPKHTPEQVHETSDMNESKIDNSNREISDAEAPKKTTLWGNLKSFANGIMNIWKKL